MQHETINTDNKFKASTNKIGPKRCPTSDTTYERWTERKMWGPKIGLKKYPSSATTHRWWTERKMVGPKIGLIKLVKKIFGYENRTQKISIAGHNP